VKELEARGIGRPSTYASVISTVQDRGYVWRKGTALVPSWTSFAVVNLLERHFDELVDYDFTARMEEDLDAISRGEQQFEPWLAKFYFGDGSPGLHARVNEQLPEIDARGLSTIPLGDDDAGHPVVLRVGKYGPYVQRGDQTGQVPADVAPDELTVAMAVDYIERQNAPDKVLGNDPETGLPVIAKDGRYGPYVQLGERVEGSKARPKTGSLFKTMTLDRITLDDALQLLSLPRTVGEVEVEGDDGTTKTIPITAQNGRFGPYISRGTESRSLEREEQLFTVTLDDARALFAQPKRGRGRREPTVLRELGEHPTTGKPLKILAGTYGPYVSDGDGTNASLPKGKAPEQVDLEEAVDLLAQRAAKGPSTKKPTRRRKS
jgi:DNA topoisomerase I